MIDKWFFREVDGASLAVFRIIFGGCMLFEAVNYGVFLCLDCLYRDTELLFKYHHFEWVTMPPGIGLELLFLVMGIAAIGVMLGWYYRVSIIVLTIVFTWHFLLDQALYLNHFYLAILFAVILCFVPAHRVWSMDATRLKDNQQTVPAWALLWPIVQLEIVLLYAGFVKLNMDWLNLEPMRLWMTAESRNAAPIFQWLTQDPGIALASYGVILLHLVGAPLLLWQKTRLPVFLLYAVFHLINAFVFDIGIFPFLTLGATLLLFDPAWPRHVAAKLQSRRPGAHWIARWRLAEGPRDSVQGAPGESGGRRVGPGTAARAMIIAGISAWLVLQVAVPLRHFVLPGDVAWNEAGHRFSWRMKLRSKRGQAAFYVQVEDGERFRVNPTASLTRKQARKMTCIPDLLWQYAQYLEKVHGEDGRYEVKVYVDTLCSLNTRRPVSLINRLVDLTAIPRDEPATNWITPLTQSLPHKLF